MRHKIIMEQVLVPGFQGGQQPSAQLEKKRVEEVWDLCQECQEWLWKMVEEFKAEKKHKSLASKSFIKKHG